MRVFKYKNRNKEGSQNSFLNLIAINAASPYNPLLKVSMSMICLPTNTM